MNQSFVSNLAIHPVNPVNHIFKNGWSVSKNFSYLVSLVVTIFYTYCRFPGMQTLPSDALFSSLDPASVSSEELLHQLAAQQKSRKKWLLIQPISNTSMMVDSGTVSMPLNLIMVATLVGKLFDVTFYAHGPGILIGGQGTI